MERILFANELIFLARIDSVNIYKMNCRYYVEIKTTAGKYVEEFSEQDCSEIIQRLNASNPLFHGDTPENMADQRKFEEARARLVARAEKRRDEILDKLSFLKKV